MGYLWSSAWSSSALVMQSCNDISKGKVKRTLFSGWNVFRPSGNLFVHKWMRRFTCSLPLPATSCRWRSPHRGPSLHWAGPGTLEDGAPSHPSCWLFPSPAGRWCLGSHWPPVRGGPPCPSSASSGNHSGWGKGEKVFNKNSFNSTQGA